MDVEYSVLNFFNQSLDQDHGQDLRRLRGQGQDLRRLIGQGQTLKEGQNQKKF